MQNRKRLAGRLGALLFAKFPLTDPLVRGLAGTWQDVSPGLAAFFVPSMPAGQEQSWGSTEPLPVYSAWQFAAHIPVCYFI